LRDFGNIRQGTARAIVEQTFTEAGGLTFFGGATTYVYRRCRYITMTVKFQPAVAGEKSGSDTVISVSKLSIDYEAKD
jgi:hypothetical protein